MTARLLSWPVGIRKYAPEPLSGPRAVGSSSTQSSTNYVQTVASPFGLWRWQWQVEPLRGAAFRRYRGFVTALHGGANAARISFCDFDRMSLAEADNDATPSQIQNGIGWSNGLPWSNGKNWKTSPPLVSVGASAALDATTITLSSDHWGYSLDIGDYIGFTPFHFGMYTITEKLATDGQYRIWPPLRKAITTSDFATLEPVLAMRLESESSAPAGRGAFRADNLTITMVEVYDYDVRDWFTG